MNENFNRLESKLKNFVDKKNDTLKSKVEKVESTGKKNGRDSTAMRKLIEEI